MSRYSKYLGQMFRVDAGENYVRVVAKYPGYANVSLKMALNLVLPFCWRLMWQKGE